MASGTIDVYVKIPTGRTAQYYMRPSDTIETVCKQLAEEEHVKVTQVQLKYQGKVLDRNHTMNYLGVRPETILKAEILVPRTVTLLVALPNDLGQIEVMSTSLDTVSDLISKISDIIKEEVYRVVLMFDGRQVRGITLMDAGLINGSAVQVQIWRPGASATETAGENERSVCLKEEDKQAILSSFTSGGRPVEVVFSFDTTGSMHSCLAQVRSKLSESCTRLIQDIPNIRIGVIAHGDYGVHLSSYVIRCLDLMSDVQAIVTFVTSVPSTNGEDIPECYEWVLRKAQGLDWSEDSAKALVVIGDAYPHPPSFTTAQVFWKDELSVLTGMGIKVYGVQALNLPKSKDFYQELADVSGGHYLTMTDFGVITDMFLAVCYREANQEDLAQFEQEVQEAGRMTEERRQIFNSLLKQDTPGGAAREAEGAAAYRVDHPQRYVKEGWWDPSLDQSDPLFHYDPLTDRFSLIPGARPGYFSSRSNSSSSPDTPMPTTLKRTRNSMKCSIM